MVAIETLPVDIRLTPEQRAAALAADARSGLREPPRSLPSKWLYDRRGSELFEDITELAEYYPTRVEAGILAAHGADIAAVSGARTLVEIGSGASKKTRLLLGAMAGIGRLEGFVGLDVDGDTLREALVELAVAYGGLEVAGVVGDFEEHLGCLPERPDRLIAFLGSTIGNLSPEGRRAFLDSVAAVLAPGETLLVGVDLVKAPDRLVAAYDDPGGVTAAFEKNVLAVVNTALDATFDLDRFAYRAVWSPRNERVEMGLISQGAQQVHVRALDLVVDFDDGEELRTEISTKFHLHRMGAELAAARLNPVGTWTDPAHDFGLILARRTS